MQHVSFLKQLELLGAALGLLSTTEALAQTAFTPGNYVVVQVGTTGGTTALSNVATALYLNEYSPAGALVQQVAVPAADASPNLALTASGTATSEANLTRSADGRYLVLTGYNAAAGTAGVASTAVATVNRVIGRVASTGTVNTTTRISDAFDTNNIRSAASADGSGFYAVGGNSGVRYLPFGNTGATTALNTTTPLNLRAINLFGGNVYATSSSATSPATTPATGTYGVVQVGTGRPTTAGQSVALLPGFPNTSGASPYAFFFTDQSAAVAGPDVVYVADDRTTTDGGIQKWSLVGGTWALNGTIGSTTAALRGLTGSASGTTVTLVATGAGGLYTVADNAGYNAAPTTTSLPAALVTPAANTAFRGVAPAPLATALAARPASAQELSLYPNPATDVLIVALPGTPALGHTAELRDLLGRPVRVATLPASGQLSLAGLRPGPYLLVVDGTLTRRIMKTE